jgi:hypothetical protein
VCFKMSFTKREIVEELKIHNSKIDGVINYILNKLKLQLDSVDVDKLNKLKIAIKTAQ